MFSVFGWCMLAALCFMSRSHLCILTVWEAFHVHAISHLAAAGPASQRHTVLYLLSTASEWKPSWRNKTSGKWELVLDNMLDSFPLHMGKNVQGAKHVLCMKLEWLTSWLGFLEDDCMLCQISFWFGAGAILRKGPPSSVCQQAGAHSRPHARWNKLQTGPLGRVSAVWNGCTLGTVCMERAAACSPASPGER